MTHATTTDRAALAPLEGQKIVLTATFQEVHRHVGSRNKVMDALFLGAEVRPLNPEVVIAETTAIQVDHLWCRLSLRQGEALSRGGFRRQVTLAGTVRRYERADGSVSWGVQLEEAVNLDEVMADLSLILRSPECADQKASSRTAYRWVFDQMDLGLVVFSFNRPTNRVLAGIRAEFNEIQAQRAKALAGR